MLRHGNGFEALLLLLGHEIQDAEEESYLLFSQTLPNARSLGFFDAKADTISLSLGANGRDLTIAQSPTLLNSSISTGTTGAVLWKVSPLVAAWLSQTANPLFDCKVLTSESTVLELGCGIAGVTAIALAPRIARYVCTDQEYVLKLLRQNLAENSVPTDAPVKKRTSKATMKRKNKPTAPSAVGSTSSSRHLGLISNIQVFELDWETSSISPLPTLLGPALQCLDAVIACDCIYNSHLIPPLVQTCADICRLRGAGRAPMQPTVCIVAQQLRSDEVFEEWLKAFMQKFRVWRIPDLLLDEDLRSGTGFVVHVGILQE